MTTTVTTTKSLPGRAVAVALAHGALRWVAIIAVTLLAFHSTWAQLMNEIRSGVTGGYVLLTPPLATLVAVGVTRRRKNELPIHDRQTDVIVCVLLLLISLAIKGLLAPRYASNYQVMHLDVLAAWVFVCGSCVAMFGLRVTSAYWPAWMMLFLTSPIVYRVTVVELGGTKYAAGAVSVVLAATAIGLAARSSRTKGFVAGTATSLVGAAVLWIVNLAWPDAPIGVSQYVPAVVAALVVGSAVYLHKYRGFAPRTLPPNPVAPKEAAKGLLYIVPTALLLAVIPLPDQKLTPVSPGPPPSGTASQIVPQGWSQIGSIDYEWHRAFFGPTSQMRRQILRADEPRPEWDRLMRPRTVAVQTLQVRRVGSFAAYPTESMYQFGSSRVSPKRSIDLGRGVTAEYFTVVDDDLLLTWSILVFVWTRGDDLAQRVSLLTVDNHELDAPFPEPAPNTAANLGTLVQVFLRGGAAVEDTDPEYKDREMLTEVGRELVETQW